MNWTTPHRTETAYTRERRIQTNDKLYSHRNGFECWENRARVLWNRMENKKTHKKWKRKRNNRVYKVYRDVIVCCGCNERRKKNTATTTKRQSMQSQSELAHWIVNVEEKLSTVICWGCHPFRHSLCFHSVGLIHCFCHWMPFARSIEWRRFRNHVWNLEWNRFPFHSKYCGGKSYFNMNLSTFNWWFGIYLRDLDVFQWINSFIEFYIEFHSITTVNSNIHWWF